MAVYAIGDVQGCFDELQQLLKLIDFDSNNDTLWFCGDLVNRGPKSLEALRFVKSLGDRAITVLGNHDLHLLAKAYGYGKQLNKDTLDPIINAPDREELLGWLRSRSLIHVDESIGYVMVHAGLPPQWDVKTAQACARELEAVLRGDDFKTYLSKMYGNYPPSWQDELNGMDRLRFITNVFTRMRFCNTEGELEYKSKGAIGSQPDGYMPWFSVPGRRTERERIIFGHWSTLGVGNKEGAICLDGGCLWGGSLVALRLDVEPVQWTSLPCTAACQPGAG